MTTKRKSQRRAVTRREPKPNATLNKLADSMLERTESLWKDAAQLDTAVRDDVAKGLAYVIYAAYDTKAIAECISDFDSVDYIRTKTYEWFRGHGFVEWFCAGASTLFCTSSRMWFRVKATPNKKAKTVTLSREQVG